MFVVFVGLVARVKLSTYQQFRLVQWFFAEALKKCPSSPCLFATHPRIGQFSSTVG